MLMCYVSVCMGVFIMWLYCISVSDLFLSNPYQIFFFLNLIYFKHSSSNLFSELPAQPKEMQDNARTVILSKTTLKYPNLFCSVKATITDVIETV